MRQLNYSIDLNTLKRIVELSDSLTEVTEKLGFNPHSGNTKKNIERLIKRNNITIEHFSTVKRLKDSQIRYKKETLIELVMNNSTLKGILLDLELLPIESNYKTLKKYLIKYEIDYSHIKSGIDRKSNAKTNYSEENLRKLISISTTISEVLVGLKLGTGGSHRKTLMKYIKIYNIDISHFDANNARAKKLRAFNTTPSSKIFIENSTYNNGTCIKKRLYAEKLKNPVCEKCGQDEIWYGEKISLILDHINGIHTDNRIENLRIVCPNCNATLPTYCGKNMKKT